MQTEFRECAACAAKPGSPYLCEACLSNRTAINWLDVQLRKAMEIPKPRQSSWPVAIIIAAVFVGMLLLLWGAAALGTLMGRYLPMP